MSIRLQTVDSNVAQGHLLALLLHCRQGNSLLSRTDCVGGRQRTISRCGCSCDAVAMQEAEACAVCECVRSSCVAELKNAGSLLSHFAM